MTQELEALPPLPPPSRRRRRRGENYRVLPPDVVIDKSLMKVPTDIYLTSVQRLRILEARRERVAYFMMFGYSCARIAEELGVSTKIAYEDVEIVREQWKQATLQHVEQAAILDLTRLDFIIQGQLAAALAGDPKAAEVCIKAIIERGSIFGYRQGVTVDVEASIRELARANGYDEEKAVEVAARISMSLR